MTGKSRPTEEYDDPGEGELYQMMMLMPEPHRSYAAFTYLIGNRTTEGVPGKSQFRDKKTGELRVRNFTGIRKRDITFDSRGWMEVDHIPTLKRKVRDSTKFYRTGMVYTLGKGEASFVRIIESFLASKTEEQILWTSSRKTHWHYCTVYLQIPPKKLRGLRATKDAVVYHLGALELKEKYNWGGVDMPFHYARFNKEGMKRKMEEANK